MRHHSSFFRIATAASAAAWLLACNASTFGSDGSASGNPNDGRRPSETGEGLIGYLRDPEALEYERSNGALSIRGDEGAIAVGQGSPAGLTVCLQQAAAATVRAILAAGQQFGGSDVSTLAETLASADGSFAISVPEKEVDQAKLLSINVTGQCQDGAPTSLPLDRHGVVFMDFAKEGQFSSVKAVAEAVKPVPAPRTATATSHSVSTASTAETDPDELPTTDESIQ